MLKIQKIYIKNQDIVYQKLLKIPGLGMKRVKYILDHTGISTSCELLYVSYEKQWSLKKFVENHYGKEIGGKLRENVKKNIKFYSTIKSYRGMRHQLSLPVRGQNTRTNARTRKRQKKHVSKRFLVFKKNLRPNKYKKIAKPKKRTRSRKKRTGKI
jgi:small subunit ribosomal protein S13